jgi:hypothetical protein
MARVEQPYFTTRFTGDIAPSALSAIKEHPESLDAHRLLALGLAHQFGVIDNPTLISAKSAPSSASSPHYTSPMVNLSLYHPETVILALEEALRLDHEDTYGIGIHPSQRKKLVGRFDLLRSLTTAKLWRERQLNPAPLRRDWKSS